MDDEQVRVRLEEIAAGICDKLADMEVDPKVELTKQGMDSLDVLDYVLAVESEFNISIDNDRFDEDSLGAIDNMVGYLRTKRES